MSATAAWLACRRVRQARSTTGAPVLKADAYPIEEQFTWDVLPEQNTMAVPAADESPTAGTANDAAADASGIEVDTVRGSVVPPWSAAKPYVNLYTHKAPTTATVVGNYRLTDASTESDIHHIVLDFGSMPFPVLEGQSIGVLPPGATADGRPHHARQYSIASPRDGERPGYNNVSLTVKRVSATAWRFDRRRLLELSVRPEKGRRGDGNRSIRRHLPDAEPSELASADDLHGHRLRHRCAR